MSKKPQKGQSAKRPSHKGKIPQVIKERNWIAVAAFNRKGGAMTDRRKEAQRKACRKKLRPFDILVDIVD